MPRKKKTVIKKKNKKTLRKKTSKAPKISKKRSTVRKIKNKKSITGRYLLNKTNFLRKRKLHEGCKKNLKLLLKVPCMAVE